MAFAYEIENNKSFELGCRSIKHSELFKRAESIAANLQMGAKKKLGKLVSPLSWIERWTYFTITVASVIFICYSVYRDSLKYDGILNLYDFSPGWGWLGRDQDISNFEWNYWFAKFRDITPWYLGHIAIGRIMEIHSLQSKKYCCTIYSVVALYRLVGWQSVCVCVGHSTILYLASLTSFSLLVWITSLVLLTTLNFTPTVTIMKSFIEDDEDEIVYYLLMFTLAWCNIRATSFSIEKCWYRRQQQQQHVTADVQHSDTMYNQIVPETCNKSCTSQQQDMTSHNLKSQDVTSQNRTDTTKLHVNEGPIGYSYVDMVYYILYLPLFFTGPILTYNLFQSQINTSQMRPPVRVTYLILHLARFIFWAYFNEFILHFFYFNAIQNNTSVLQQVPLFTLAGLGYCHGQFFMLKYHVMFGYPGTIAKFDSVDPPDPPKCIAYIYLYSDMWKYFDRGLYSFLKRYIYIPVGGSRAGFGRQLLGSVLCFMYIFYWHGAEVYILLFILLNYAGVSMEQIGAAVCRISYVKHLQTNVLSCGTVQRIHGFCSIPIFLISCFSVFCFFGGKEVGYLFFKRLILEGWYGSWLVLTLLVYCAIQNAIEVNRWLERRQKSKQH